jgi:hypothetical protein
LNLADLRHDLDNVGITAAVTVAAKADKEDRRGAAAAGKTTDALGKDSP